MDESEIKEPTGDQCNSNAKVFEDERNIGHAIWYPQMGGYAGKAVVITNKEWTEFKNGAANGGCIEVLVWHDGEFPFAEDKQSPTRLHHCDAEQFITFGEKVHKINQLGRKEG